MKIQYVAFDGTIFDSEKQCLEYENTATGIVGWMALPDGLVDPYELNQNLGLELCVDMELDAMLDEAQVVWIRDEEALKRVSNYNKDLRVGINLYDGLGGWKHIDDVRNEFFTALNKLIEIEKAVELQIS